jgi:hypothetical protein
VNRELNIAGVMITCPGREAQLKATLADLRRCEVLADGHQADGNQSLRLHIQMDETTYERRQERQEHNSLAALTTGLNRFPEAEVLLFFEDDIIFNRYLVHNLQRWSPLRNAECGMRSAECAGAPLPHSAIATPNSALVFGSLYDPTVRELSAKPAEHYFIADPQAVYGSQAFVMSRAMAKHFVENWWDVEGMQDIKMSRLAALLGPIYYHQPSLVQHVGVVSTWTDDARFHDTKSFNRDFKA